MSKTRVTVEVDLLYQNGLLRDFLSAKGVEDIDAETDERISEIMAEYISENIDELNVIVE